MHQDTPTLTFAFHQGAILFKQKNKNKKTNNYIYIKLYSLTSNTSKPARLSLIFTLGMMQLGTGDSGNSKFLMGKLFL